MSATYCRPAYTVVWSLNYKSWFCRKMYFCISFKYLHQLNLYISDFRYRDHGGVDYGNGIDYGDNYPGHGGGGGGYGGGGYHGGGGLGGGYGLSSRSNPEIAHRKVNSNHVYGLLCFLSCEKL